MKYRIPVSVAVIILAVMLGIGGFSGSNMAVADRSETAGKEWNGYLDGSHTSITLQSMRTMLANEGLQRHANVLTAHPYIVRIEILETGGGAKSHSEVLFQFTETPKAVVGMAEARNDRNQKSAQIGNLESCPIQNNIYPGHTCPTYYNARGWVNLTAAVSLSNKVLVINDPISPWTANTFLWFAFNQPQNRIPYDIIEKTHGQTFGFGRISAQKFLVGATHVATSAPEARPHPHKGKGKSKIKPKPQPKRPPTRARPATVYVVGSLPVANSFSIHRWTGSTFTQIPGGAVNVTVNSNGTPWITNSNRIIFKWNGRSWEQKVGSAIDIAAGGGKIYVIGTLSKGGGNYSIHKWTGSTWIAMPGAGVRIAAQSNGNPWVINAKHNIFRWSGNTWVQVPGAAGDIGAGGGKVYVIGTSPKGGGNYSIHKWTGSTWVDLPGGGYRIDADSSGKPWLVDANKNIYKWTGATWAQIAGTALDIGAE